MTIETIRDEALQMAEMRRIRAADGHNDIGFSSFSSTAGSAST